MATVGLVFHGQINHPATTKLRNALCTIVNERVASGAGVGNRLYDKLILMMDSTGGSLDDGFSLYGLLKGLPIDLTTVNMGMIASIANVPFLAGKHRYALPHSVFHFHDYEWNYGAAHNMTRREFADHTLVLETARGTQKILLKGHTALTDADFETLKLLDDPVVRDADFAKQKRIIDDVGLPALPTDIRMFNVDY